MVIEFLRSSHPCIFLLGCSLAVLFWVQILFCCANFFRLGLVCLELRLEVENFLNSTRGRLRNLLYLRLVRKLDLTTIVFGLRASANLLVLISDGKGEKHNSTLCPD